jgi:thiol-disulfide isomerase/thioredoxin
MNKTTLVIIITAIIAGAAGVFVRDFFSKPSPPPAPVAKPAFLNAPLATKLPDLTGRLQKLSQWQGKILIVNFWATWCPPCLTEIPEFISLQQQYADKNIQVIGIAIDNTQVVRKFDEKVKFNYPVLIAGDAGMDIAKSWGNVTNTVPFTVVINTEGEIIHRQLGEVTRDKLLELIQPLLKMRVVSLNRKHAI